VFSLAVAAANVTPTLNDYQEHAHDSFVKSTLSWVSSLTLPARAISVGSHGGQSESLWFAGA